MVRYYKLQNRSAIHAYQISFSRWRYSPGWVLASSTICLQASRFLALSLHSFTPIFLRSMDTSSSHLIFGLPLRLVAYSFPYNIFFGGLRCLAFFLYDQAIVFFAFNKPECSPPWLWLLINRFVEFSIILFFHWSLYFPQDFPFKYC